MDGEKRKRLSGPLRAGLVAAAVAMMVVPLTAIGDSDGNDDADKARQKFEDCLRDNGVPVPKEGGPLKMRLPDDKTIGELKAAHRKCEDLLPEDAHFMIGKAPPEVRAKLREFADCMQKNGVDVPEPGEGPKFRHELPPPGAQVRPELDTEAGPDAERFERAERECRHLLPEPPQGARAFPGPPCDGDEEERKDG